MDLSWDAPAECPTGAEIRADVGRIVGPNERRHVVVEARARRDGNGWTLELRTRAGDDEGERTIHGATCAEIAKAGVVVIALAIDPNVLRAPPPPPPVVVPAPPPPPPPAVVPPVPPSKGRSIFVVVRASVGGSVAIPPGTAAFAAFAAGVSSKRFAAHAGVSFSAATASNAEALPSAGGSFWLFTVSARGCAAPFSFGDRFELWGCGGLEVDRLAAEGFGVTNPRTAEAWFPAPNVAIEPAFAILPQLRLVASVGGAFPLDRPSFTLEGVGPAFRLPPALGRISLGTEVRF